MLARCSLQGPPWGSLLPPLAAALLPRVLGALPSHAHHAASVAATPAAAASLATSSAAAAAAQALPEQSHHQQPLQQLNGARGLRQVRAQASWLAARALAAQTCGRAAAPIRRAICSPTPLPLASCSLCPVSAGVQGPAGGRGGHPAVPLRAGGRGASGWGPPPSARWRLNLVARAVCYLGATSLTRLSAIHPCLHRCTCA